MTSKTIQGTNALVTGANRGIGRAIVEALLERGAEKVYAGARNVASLESLVGQYGDRVVPVQLDVTSQDDINGAVEQAGDIDLLINNAGVASHMGGGFDDAAWLDAGRDEMNVNVWGTLAVTQAFAPALQANGGGSVVNVVSTAAMVNFPIFLSYSASKAALHSITQGTRLLLAGQGTTVIGAYPGPVDTDMAEEVPFDKAPPSAVANSILDAVEAGQDEVYTDPMAEEFGALYEQSPKALEHQVAAMFAEAPA